MTKKKNNEEVFEVSFKIHLKRFGEEYCDMPSQEMRANISYQLEHWFEDYFKKFKIKSLRCRRVK